MYPSAILPIGRINLKTGNSRYFNVYENWGNNTTYEIYREFRSGKIKIVATSGTRPLRKIGETIDAAHDQTRRFMFSGELVDFAVGNDLKGLAETYGNSILGYVYK